MAHWINITGRTKGQKFQCSECGGKVTCIGVGCASKYITKNYCDYEWCPRCGIKMEIEDATILVPTEKRLSNG